MSWLLKLWDKSTVMTADAHNSTVDEPLQYPEFDPPISVEDVVVELAERVAALEAQIAEMTAALKSQEADS